ncbi:hypothetical protein FLP41_15935 [Paracoccus marcusii]|uniref:hypothetical protein n=1 Tax=Paracoccus marcusii TaxID=59779 RepID=UPI002ED57C9E|nr:hypothetical protein FLP41_15935 [Paracoccus marcusii]
MIKLDEHVSRDDFEQELHALVDEQKAAIRNVLQDILTKRLYAFQTARKDVVMKISWPSCPVTTGAWPARPWMRSCRHILRWSRT